MDGKTRTKRAPGRSQDAHRSRPRRGAGVSGEQAGTLRARLIAATVELLAEGSDPRLDKTGYTPVVA